MPSPIGGLLRAGLSTLGQAWGYEDIGIGAKIVRGIWNESDNTAQLTPGGFDPTETATVLIAVAELASRAVIMPERGALITARGRTWRVVSARREADYAVHLTVVPPSSSS
jgi:hypothetical protein